LNNITPSEKDINAARNALNKQVKAQTDLTEQKVDSGAAANNAQLQGQSSTTSEIINGEEGDNREYWENAMREKMDEYNK